MPWASNAGIGFINAIPSLSQIGIKDGRASFPDGFPPLCFVPVSSGGVPPFGADFNGILNQLSAGLEWLQIGMLPVWDPTYNTQIGGYPQDAVVASPNYTGLLWISLVDNNTSNPDTDTGLYWSPFNRWRLTSPLVLYVNAGTGNDSNTGLTPGSPWITLQKAIDWIANNVDVSYQTVTVNCAGTFSAGVANYRSIAGNGANRVIFSFNSGSLVSVADGTCFLADGDGTGFTVTTASGVPVQLAASGTGVDQGYCLLAADNAQIFFNNINFGYAQQSQVFAFVEGAVKINGNYTISGNSPIHWNASNGTIQSVTITNPNVVTLIGPPGYSTCFANCTNAGRMLISPSTTTFNGTATGQRFNVSDVSIISTGGAGLEYFPGGVAGVAQSAFNYT